MRSYTTTTVRPQQSEERSEQQPQPPPASKPQQTTSRPRDFFQRTPPVFPSIGLAERVPFEVRSNPLVDRDHPEFVRIERYFFTLLRNSNLTIQEILDGTFEPHEISILEPVSHPPELVKLQKTNSIRYQQILDTRFKGSVPTLQLKLAFLYFGLPVAPMKTGSSQKLVIRDLDFLEDQLEVANDPLGFLDEYADRTYGEPNRHVPNRYFLQLPPTQEFTSLRLRPRLHEGSSLRLRGGAAPSNMEWEPEGDTASGSVKSPVRIFGYQGSILVDPADSAYDSFVTAVDQLLGLRYKYNYSIRLQIWDQTGSGSEPLAQATGMIYQKGKWPGGEDDISALVTRLFGQENADRRYCGFVLFDKEELPEFFQPSSLDDRYVVRVWDEDKKNMAYMRVPNTLQQTHRPNQFSQEYLRAMRALFQKPPHQYFKFSTSEEESTYGLFDPPPDVWDQVIQDQTKNDELPLLNFSTIDVPDDLVPVFIPGFNSYDTDFSGTSGKPPVTTLGIDDLKLDKDDGVSGVSRLISAVNAANPFAITDQKKVGLQVWIPGNDFLNTTVPGRFINLVGTEINDQTKHDWKSAVRSYQGPRIHAQPGKINIVARPIFSTYNIHKKNQAQSHFSVDLNDLKLSEFKEEVKSKIFPRYNPNLKNLVLHLVQSTWSGNGIDFVISTDTDESGWQWIVRHITEPDLTISIEYWENGWVVEKGSTWGPRYDTKEPLSLTSKFDAMNKGIAPYDPPVQRAFIESKNNLEGARRAQYLRERLFWDNASIFANPTKPALPLQGPPIETLIMTGPNVPAFTVAMRTPTEVARLEKEVHTLRGNLLDRVRECPYQDCERIFRFQDGSELDRHLREDHTTLQCFLCDKEKHVLRFYDAQSIRQHFLDNHYDSIKEELFGITGKQGPSEKSSHMSTCSGLLQNNQLPSPPSAPKAPAYIEPTRIPEKEETIIEPPAFTEQLKPESDPFRRSPSPPWDEFLEPQSRPWAFAPQPDWRCSRCFRAAGDAMNEIEMHMNERGSCRIRRTLGTTKYGPVPNRSGWIIPEEGFDFREAYIKFTNEYPAYRHTMFPRREESIARVWNDPDDLKKAHGSIEDDPNYMGSRFPAPEIERLPWPPYTGEVTPVVEKYPPGPEYISSEGESTGDSEFDDDYSDNENGGSVQLFGQRSQAVNPLEEDVSMSTEENSEGSYGVGSDEPDDEYDPRKQPADTEDELLEEYSERSAVSDPIQELGMATTPRRKRRRHLPPPAIKTELNSPHGIDYVPWLTPQPLETRTGLAEWDATKTTPRSSGRGSQPPTITAPKSGVSRSRRATSGPPSSKSQTRGKGFTFVVEK
ncbi:hypothetical protein F5Y11DRAFT_355524 [Daldinia sp. FL1419]|nr:hypothetical protein F5Y11DRAFT_355524 [Daldinia sp. FL1419]